MRTVDRYIGNTVIGATLMVFVVFFGLRLFVGIFGELGAIGTGNYHILQAVQYVLLTMPLNIYQLYPNIALLGALAALGILASSNELTVMRASGISIAQISWSVIKASIWLIIIVTILGEAFSPALDAYAENQKSIKETQGTLSQTQSQLWLHEGNGFINIGASDPKGVLHDITQFVFTDDHQLTSASYAQSANFVNGSWVVHDIVTSDFKPGRVITTHFDQQNWQMDFKPHLLAVVDPDQLSLIRLQEQTKYNKQNGLDASTYTLAFWLRVLQPLATLVMVFLAIPFIFGPLRSSTMGLRILSGVMVGLAFYIINRFFGPFTVVYQIPPFAAAIIPILLFALLACILIRRKG